MGDVFVTTRAYRKFFPNCAWRANYAILLRAMGRNPEADEMATRASRIRAHYR